MQHDASEPTGNKYKIMQIIAHSSTIFMPLYSRYVMLHVSAFSTKTSSGNKYLTGLEKTLFLFFFSDVRA